MSVASEVKQIAAKLQIYEEQMTAIGHALDSLKTLAAVVTTAMATDRVALLEAVQSQTAPIETFEPELACCSESVAAHPEVAVLTAKAEAPALVQHEPSIETTATDARHDQPDCDTQAAPVETTALEHTEAHSVAPDNETVLAITAALSKNEPDIEPIAVAAGDTVIEKAADRHNAVEIAPGHPSYAVSPTPSEAEATTAAPAPASAHAAAGGKVIELSKARSLREHRGSPVGRRLIGAMAAIAISVGGTIGIQEFLQTEAAQRLIELSACDADAMAASRECALIGWLLL